MGCANSSEKPGKGEGASDAGGAGDKKANNDNRQLLKEYTLGDVLGQGAFGVVYECCKKTDKKMDFAVKMVDKVETPVAEIKKEAEMMEELAHANVVKFISVYYEKCFVCIVMMKYGGGDLIEGMQLHWKSKGKIPCAKVRHINRQMAAAIAHLHSKQYVHRDVKGDNYLTDRKDITDPGCQVLMSDFGTAVKLKTDTERLRASCGTKIYWPPEFYDRNYSFKVDCWALGVIMFGLVDGRFPFKTEQDVRRKEVKLPSSTPPDCLELVVKLLSKDEGSRLDSASLLSHVWIKDASGAAPDEVKGPDDPAFAPDTFREGGANAGQDERRQELVDRLENAGNKAANTTQMSVLWNAKFDVNDRRNGKSLRYEWKTMADVEVAMPDLSSAQTYSNETAEDNKETVQKTLESHNISIASWGTGSAKTLAQFATEVQTGAASLMLDAEHHKKLVRVVDVCLLRLKSSDGRYLAEDSEIFSDGRTRSTGRLPGTKKEPHENVRTAIARVLKDMLGLASEKVAMKFDDKEYFEEEEDSISYPGVRTVYRKEIVEGVFSGPPTDFKFKDAASNEKQFKWASASDCESKGIKLTAPAEGDDVTGLVQAPIGLDEEELHAFLSAAGVDTAPFGQGHAKTMKEFSAELQKGESTLMKGADGKIVRIVDVVLMLINKQGTTDTLMETQCKYKDGKTDQLNRLPGTKRRPDENQFVTARRVLKRQLKMDDNLVTLDQINVRATEERKASDNFPGIETLYRKRFIKAELIKL